VAAEIDGHGYGGDISDLAAVEQLASTIEGAHGPVSGLVVSSGAFQDRLAPADIPMEVWNKLVKVNLDGTFFANRVFGTLMARRGKGSIVNVASNSGYGSTPLHGYGATKAAVINLTKNLAGQWGRSGVRVNSVSPGPTIVPRQALRAPGRYSSDMENHLALGRRLQPPEIAEGVEFLLSDKASAVTGHDLLMDAGMVTASMWGLYGGVPAAVGED
jgi:NAD(P)-dependent dehydrogenase (short-subunit alcohol dehydrogenase family)